MAALLDIRLFAPDKVVTAGSDTDERTGLDAVNSYGIPSVVEWAVHEGIADKGRVCIRVSYGGYAHGRCSDARFISVRNSYTGGQGSRIDIPHHRAGCDVYRTRSQDELAFWNRGGRRPP